LFSLSHQPFTTRYQTGIKLSGIIYFHRVSDERFTGIDVRNFGVFRKLCGEKTLKNVAIVTNMWEKVDLETGEARERQMSTKFFKPAIDKGARFLRHVNTKESAHSVIRTLLDNDLLAFQIQEELVDNDMEFTQTAAGQEIRRGLDKHAEALGEKIKELQSELEEAENKERETQRELEEQIRELRASLEKVKAESIQLEAWYQEERDEMRSKADAMMRDLLKNLGGVFKLGFLGGFLLSSLLGLAPEGGLVRNMFEMYYK
jgi:hypothetical protein